MADEPQSLDTQVAALRSVGCEHVFFDAVSTASQRSQIGLALDKLGQDDTLVVDRLETLVRSSHHPKTILRLLRGKSATLQVLSIEEMTGDGEDRRRIVLIALEAFAAFDQNTRKEQQQEARARAKLEGRYRGGRKPTARSKAGEVRSHYAQGLTISEIAQRLEISRTSVHRCLQDFDAGEQDQASPPTEGEPPGDGGLPDHHKG